MGKIYECPCRNCVPPVRQSGCHGKCEKYLSWRSVVDEVSAEERKKKEFDRTVSATIANGIANMKRKKSSALKNAMGPQKRLN